MGDFIRVFSTFFEVQTALIAEFYGIYYGENSKDEAYQCMT